MKLDRSTNSGGKGKYAVVKLRNICHGDAAWMALKELDARGCVDLGEVGKPDEFFVIKLRDKYARAALSAYADAALVDDPEYAAEVAKLAGRSGEKSPHCKTPD